MRLQGPNPTHICAAVSTAALRGGASGASRDGPPLAAPHPVRPESSPRRASRRAVRSSTRRSRICGSASKGECVEMAKRLLAQV